MRPGNRTDTTRLYDVTPFTAMTRQHITLFLIGVALSIAQFVMIRDFVSILYGEEVVIVLVHRVLLPGPVHRLSAGVAPVTAGLPVAVRRLDLSAPDLSHLLPLMAAWMSHEDVSGYWFMVLLFGYALVFNTIFATFLPRLVSLTEDTAHHRGAAAAPVLRAGTRRLHGRLSHCRRLLEPAVCAFCWGPTG